MDGSHSAHPAGAAAAEKSRTRTREDFGIALCPEDPAGSADAPKTDFLFHRIETNADPPRFFRAASFIRCLARRAAPRRAHIIFPSYLPLLDVAVQRFNNFSYFFPLNIIHRQLLPPRFFHFPETSSVLQRTKSGYAGSSPPSRGIFVLSRVWIIFQTKVEIPKSYRVYREYPGQV